jgi:hypothetical protein
MTLKIALGPLEISGIYVQLAKGIKENGYEVKFIKLFPDLYPELDPCFEMLGAKNARNSILRYRESSSALKKKFHQISFFLKSLVILGIAIFKFDVFIFAWGKSLMPLNIDLPILRLLRKKVIVNLGHGSEARPPYMSFQDLDFKVESELDFFTITMSSRPSFKLAFGAIVT